MVRATDLPGCTDFVEVKFEDDSNAFGVDPLSSIAASFSDETPPDSPRFGSPSVRSRLFFPVCVFSFSRSFSCRFLIYLDFFGGWPFIRFPSRQNTRKERWLGLRRLRPAFPEIAKPFLCDVECGHHCARPPLQIGCLYFSPNFPLWLLSKPSHSWTLRVGRSFFW